MRADLDGGVTAPSAGGGGVEGKGGGGVLARSVSFTTRPLAPMRWRERRRRRRLLADAAVCFGGFGGAGAWWGRGGLAGRPVFLRWHRALATATF
nr:unnamed protein product [Digitaria exilis]